MHSLLITTASTLIGLTVMVYLVYFRRHVRRDLATAYMALGVGVFAITWLLTTLDAGIGLGLGLFGVLSIIRLRSDTLTQEEVAYYFMSLVIGLVNGLHPAPGWLAPAATALLVTGMMVFDHPGIARRTTRQVVTLDRAYPRAAELTMAVEELLDARVLKTVVVELDLVRDLTVVDVRFRLNHTPGRDPLPTAPLEPGRVAAARLGDRTFQEVR